MLFAQAQRVPAKRERLRLKGYGKLCERVAERCCASLTAARRAHVRAPDFAIRIDGQHPRGLTIRHARGRIDLHRWCQSSRQHIGAFHGIPTAGAERAGISDKHHHADPLHEKAIRVVQGYGKLSAGEYEPLPCFLHVFEHAQIRFEVVACGGLYVGVAELSCDHAYVGSGFYRQGAERVSEVAWRHAW